MSKKPVPNTDTEWAIHSINIHGEFFEEWCRSTVEDTNIWQVPYTEYPVEFPKPYTKRTPKESALDLRADLTIHPQGYLLSLVIECKKNNPDFVDWVFFQKRPLQKQQNEILVAESYFSYPSQIKVRRKEAALNWPLTSKGRETRGSYSGKKTGDITKTSNAAISDASYQVALATQALLLEDVHDGSARSPNGAHVYIPVIVTSARLFIYRFDPHDVDGKTGEIPFDKVIVQQRPYLFFEYPVPKHLQSLQLQEYEVAGPPCTWMHILVVHSESFNDLLTELSRNLKWFFKGIE